MKRIFAIDSPFVNFAEKIFDCICLSILWIIFSIPIFTIGASSTALYSTMYNCICKGNGGLLKNFVKAFKENFKRSTLIWLIALAIISLLIIDVFVFRGLKINGDPLGQLYWLSLVLMLVGLTWLIYLSAYSAKFNGSVFEVLRLSIILLAAHPLRAIGVAVPIVCGFMLALIMPGLLLILPAAIYWASSFALEKIFLLHMRPEDIEKITEEQQ